MRLVTAKGFKPFGGEKAPIGQDGVERLNRMAFAVDIAIAVRISKILRRDIHNVIVQHIQDIDARKAAGGMTGAAALNHGQDCLAILN